MTAIGGAWIQGAAGSAMEACRIGLGAMEMYGPDNTAGFDAGPVALGRCLMRLLPEDRADRQPLLFEERTSCLVADARIDNREDLARKLGILSSQAILMADSEFILAAWQRWGEDCVDHLLGAFTFAVWEGRDQRLFLARDQVGERPLFYYHREGLFAFATMPKGLLALPGIPVELDEELLGLYLAILPVPTEKTLFRGILRIPHGNCLSVTRDGLRLREYWHPQNTPPLRLRSDADYLDAFRHTLDEAVHCRLRTTGQVGTELSGGLDSSSVTVTAARLLAQQGRGITAFTHVPRPGFQAPEVDRRFSNEGPAAAEIAAMYPNIEHVLVPNGSRSMLDILSPHVDRDDQPVFNPTNTAWIDGIFDEARSRNITALLTGRCGNGSISYDGFIALADFFRSGHWLKLARYSLGLQRNREISFRRIGGITVLPILPEWLQQRLAPRVGSFDLDYCAVNPELAAQLNLKDRSREAFNFQSWNVRSDLNALFVESDLGNSHAGDMAGWRLEVRDPTYDKRMVEFIYSIPIEQFLRGGRFRSLVRRAMRGLLPDRTVNRTSRGLQAADWFEGMGAILPQILAEIDLLEQSPIARRVLDLERMRRLIDTWPRDGFQTSAVQVPYHYALSRGLGAGRFLRHFDPSAPKS